MEKHYEVIEKAGQLYGGKCHCCEAICLAVSEYFGCSDELIFKISSPFGMGIAKNQDVCGSLIAACICAGMVKGRKTQDDSREETYAAVDRLYKRFREKYGSTSCRDIVKYDAQDAKALQENGSRIKNEVCIPLAKEVTKWILEELDH